ncbi:MAG: hypothetical protein ACOYN2_03155 [Patescibacteria group bacterium]
MNSLVWLAGSMVLLVAGAAFYAKTHQSTLPVQETAVSSGTLDAYIQSLSATGSHLAKSPVYAKGELLEVVYFITPESTLEFIADLHRLNEWLTPESLKINDTKTPIIALDKPIAGSGSTIIKVTGRAKFPGNSDSMLGDSTAKIEFTGKKTSVVRPKIVQEEANTRDLTLVAQDFSVNENNLIQITGLPEVTKKVRYLNIGGKSFPALNASGSVYAVVERGEFEKGEYFVGAFLDDGKLVGLDGKVSFTGERKAVNIVAIVPNRVSSEKETYVVLQGNGLSKIVSFQLSNSFIFKNPSFSITSDGVAVVKIPKGLTPGSYIFNMMDTKGIYTTDTTTLTVY